MPKPTKQLAQENPPPREAEFVKSIADRLKARIIAVNTGGVMRRDAHPKMHGVVKAEFIVEPNLPPELRVGVFAEPKTYRAWIRFSNQNDAIRADHKIDIRGMAIKLMGVPGEKLLEEERHEQTQDFIVISPRKFVTRDVEQFDGLLKALDRNLLAQAWFFVTHLPYLWGRTAVKYSTIPQVDVPDRIPRRGSDDYLREAMIRQLGGGEARFDFTVQLQTDADRMPIEDPGKEWSESLSPYRKVATIVIPQQQFDSEKQRAFGDNLSFTPWHSIPDHRPLGGVNRARKMAYPFISKFRHERNSAPRREPTSWDIEG
jgi:hypothetical protein